MAQFTFPLETVLRHRRHIEQQKQRDLAAVEAEMQRERNAMDELNRSVQANMTDLRDNRLVGRLDMAFLAGHRRYMGAVQRQAMLIAQRMSLLQKRIDEARQAVTEAAKQRKVLEKLEEKQKQRWAADIARRETAELDDAAMKAATRKMFAQSAEALVPNAAQPDDR